MTTYVSLKCSNCRNIWNNINPYKYVSCLNCRDFSESIREKFKFGPLSCSKCRDYNILKLDFNKIMCPVCNGVIEVTGSTIGRGMNEDAIMPKVGQVVHCGYGADGRGKLEIIDVYSHSGFILNDEMYRKINRKMICKVLIIEKVRIHLDFLDYYFHKNPPNESLHRTEH